jgi:L-fuconolactonase
MIGVDAHQHFWRVARGDYGWLPAHPKIHRDFLPRDLAPLLKSADIAKTVLVQAAPTRAETDFLLALARETPFVAGVVGWIDFEAPQAADEVERLAADPLLVGLRPMIQDLPADDWVLSPALAPVFRAMADAGLRLDALVKPRHLAHLRTFLARHRELRVVIDHGAKPHIRAGEIDHWAREMEAIARDTPAFCKLSGLATEADEDWSHNDLKPYVDVLVESFGPQRLMWGSDWPVVNEGGGFARWHETAQALTAHLSSAERDAIFGGTAEAFYAIASQRENGE